VRERVSDKSEKKKRGLSHQYDEQTVRKKKKRGFDKDVGDEMHFFN
jgi:hypothetical protein